MQFIIKTIFSAIIIATIATVSKKLPSFGAIIASLPLTSILAMIWLYQDTKDISKIIVLSNSIFLIIIPSLIFFIALPILLKKNLGFYSAMCYSTVIMLISYFLYLKILKFLHIDF